MIKPKALCPSNFHEFKCIGSECEDSCCVGWRIDIDKATYHLYKQNRHKALESTFKTAVKRNENSNSAKKFGVISIQADGRCSFLDNDKLCRIQRNLGHEALSSTCSTYPRCVNLFGDQWEYSLILSCPAAARLVLLDRDPVYFVEVDENKTLNTIETVEQMPVAEAGRFATLNDFRALVIGILQFRELTIDQRLIYLGLLLESVEPFAGENFESAGEFLPDILGQFAIALEDPAAIRLELDQATANPLLKLAFLNSALAELVTQKPGDRLMGILTEAAQGLAFTQHAPKTDEALIACHINTRKSIYDPFFDENPHILENYLVNYAFSHLFPLVKRGGLLGQYREFVCNYLTISTLLLGQAAFHGKLTEELVIGSIQSLTRLSTHCESYLEKIVDILNRYKLTGFQSLFPLISNSSNLQKDSILDSNLQAAKLPESTEKRL